MEYKELGKTGIKVPEIGLGTWLYSGGREPLLNGLDMGAFLIDTAEGYGTEVAVGDAISERRNEVFLATKVSPSNLRYDDVLIAADRSLHNLATDYIDLYQVHWPNPGIPIEETMGAMDHLIMEGKVRFVGVSNFSAEQLRLAQGHFRNQIVSNQVLYNLIDRHIESEVMPYCEANNITVIAYSPFGQNLDSLKESFNGELGRIALEVGKTEAQVALNWCIAKEKVIVIPKSNSIERTTENCNSSGWRLNTDQLKRLDSLGNRRDRIPSWGNF